MNKNSGFTLIEIIVVLIIVGVLASIALPNLFANVNKSKAHEALASFEPWKINMDVCLNSNLGNEGVCAQGAGAKAVALPSSKNFAYTMAVDAANTAPPSTGISADTPRISAHLNNGNIADNVTLTRNADGTWTPGCDGAFSGVCNSTLIAAAPPGGPPGGGGAAN